MTWIARTVPSGVIPSGLTLSSLTLAGCLIAGCNRAAPTPAPPPAAAAAPVEPPIAPPDIQAAANVDILTKAQARAAAEAEITPANAAAAFEQVRREIDAEAGRP